jgi:predicted exporter
LKPRRAWLVLLPLWLLVLAGLAFLVTQRLQVGGDLRSFMPAPSTPDQRLLLDQVGEGAASRLLMLALSGRPEAQLARLSQQLAQRLRGDRRYTQVLNGGFEIDALDPRLLPYRYLLSPTLDTQPLDTAYLSDQLQQRLEDLSSPAASLLKGLLPRDPTLELLKLAQRWTPAQSPALRHGVWFSAQHEALLLVQTQAGGFDPAAQQAAVDGLRQALAALPDQAGVELTISGPGYFSMVAAAQTRQQAEWIGRISSAGFVLLLLLAYRNVGALLLSALPIASAALAGLAALVLIFPQVHGITLAFGFTLLGVAQEYPIRLLSHRRAEVSALASARALWPPLLTAIASACIAYLAFYASGVNGLKQLAVFTIVGLLVAGLSTRYLLPHLLPQRVRDVAQLAWLGGARRWLDDLPRPRWIAPLLALAAAVMLWLAPGPFWQNDLSALTPLPRTLLQRDAQLRAALGAPDARYLLLLRAPTEQGVLGLSERLEPQVSALIASHALDALELPSLYLPSLATQQARQQKLPERAALQASLAQATQGLPFRQQLFEPFVDDVALARQLPLLTPQRYAQSPLGQRLAAMLLPYDGQWLGLAMISGLHDPPALQRLADASGGQLRLLDMKGAAESLVAAYRKRILQALLVAGVLLIVTIAVSLRSLRRAWHVLAPMTLATFLVLAVERVAGVEISLFHLVALMLAGGLGLHYALFFERDGADPAERRRTLHATVVCAASALLVFGMLAWASIPVLRAIGLTVSLGVAFHFCLSVLMAAPVSSAVAKEGSAP